MLLKNKCNNTNSSYMLLLVFTLGVFTLNAQHKKVTYSAGIGPLVVMDYDYPRLGIGTEYFVEAKFFKKIGLQLNLHKVEISHFVTGKNVAHFLSSTATDSYGNYFRGKSVEYFGGKKGTSFIKNAKLLSLNLNYQFGNKNPFLAQFGISVGKAQESKIFLKGISSSNGIIINASSEATFFNNYVYGVNLAIGKQWHLNENYFIRLNGKMCLTRPSMYMIGFTSYINGELFYESLSLSIQVGKFISFKKNKIK